MHLYKCILYRVLPVSRGRGVQQEGTSFFEPMVAAANRAIEKTEQRCIDYSGQPAPPIPEAYRTTFENVSTGIGNSAPQ